MKEGQVNGAIMAGTILIRDGSLLPEIVRLERAPCVAGWQVVTNFNDYELDRAIQKAGWTFFCRAGEMSATVFGIDNRKMQRRAIERILARKTPDQFNSLEITRVDSVGSGRFPLVRYVTVSAQRRHIQKSLFPFSIGNVPTLHLREGDIHNQATESAVGPALHRLTA